MLARLRGINRVAATKSISRRFASNESTPSSFTNKYNFNINPPPVHEYWNIKNASVLIAFVPLYFAVGYVAKSIGTDLDGYEGLLEFADSEKSPMKELKFGEAQPFPEEK